MADIKEMIQMKKRHFDVETDGFYGSYWKCKTGSDCAMIAMIGDDPEDYLARTSVKWLHKLGVNVMTMSPGKKDYGHHNYPLERIEKAINWLKAHGDQKIGIVGASTTGTLALTAASYFEDITLTIGLTPSDFIWQGFMQGKKDGCKEWPIEGESLFSYKGEPLPYMPFCYKHPDYWHVIKKETKRTGDMINSRKLFDDSEKAHPITEDEMIKIEKIHGTLLLIGAEDDVLWDTAKYIRRMKQRIHLLGMADTVQLGMLIGAAAGMAFCNFIIYILHLFLSFKFGLGLSLFWGVFESLQCILYSNIELKGLARYIPFAWSMNWVQDILSRQIFNYGTEKIWIAALTTGGLLLTLLWFSHWEGRKNYE